MTPTAAPRRRGALVIRPAALAGALGLVAILLASAAVTHGHMSPSYIPSLARTERLSAIGVAVAIALHLIASWRVVRASPDRLAAGNGVALVGLGLALASVAAVHAWFSPPYLDVPPPFWMVAVPTVDLAAATCALATALTLVLTVIRRAPTGRARGPRSDIRAPATRRPEREDAEQLRAARRIAPGYHRRR